MKREFYSEHILRFPDKYRKEEYKREIENLRKLTLEKSIKIVEELVTSQLGSEILKANKEWRKKVS